MVFINVKLFHALLIPVPFCIRPNDILTSRVTRKKTNTTTSRGLWHPWDIKKAAVQICSVFVHILRLSWRFFPSSSYFLCFCCLRAYDRKDSRKNRAYAFAHLLVQLHFYEHFDTMRFISSASKNWRKKKWKILFLTFLDFRLLESIGFHPYHLCAQSINHSH